MTDAVTLLTTPESWAPVFYAVGAGLNPERAELEVTPARGTAALYWTPPGGLDRPELVVPLDVAALNAGAASVAHLGGCATHAYVVNVIASAVRVAVHADECARAAGTHAPTSEVDRG